MAPLTMPCCVDPAPPDTPAVAAASEILLVMTFSQRYVFFSVLLITLKRPDVALKKLLFVMMFPAEEPEVSRLLVNACCATESYGKSQSFQNENK